jgi:DNA-binding response OmpR family regulator
MQAIVISSDQDEKDIYTYILRRTGLAVASSSSLERVLSNWTDHPADIIVASLDESAALEKSVDAVRAVTQAPLLFITNPLSEQMLCSLLLKGVDLILQRPVAPKVVSAYVQVLVKRSSAIPGFVLPSLDLDRITLDPATRTVSVSGEEPKRLTQLEFRLLYVLMTNRGQVVPLDDIVERVWGYTGEGNRDLVRGLVSRLRHKIEPTPDASSFLETIPGVGYRFTVDDI